MYQNWFVSYINQLSASETAAFLSSLEMLESKPEKEELIECALMELGEHFDLNMQVYSLPALLGMAMSDAPLSKKALRLVRQICEETVKPAQTIANTLRNRAKLLSLLRDYQIMDADGASMSENDYMELSSRADQIMAFGVLQYLTFDEITGLLEGDSDWVDYLQDAVSGKYGRFILTLAARAIACHNISLFDYKPETLLPFQAAYYAQPDMLYAWLSLNTAGLGSAEYMNVRPPVLFDKAAKDPLVCTAAEWLFRGRDNDTVTDTEIKATLRYLWDTTLDLCMIRRAVREGTVPNLTKTLSKSWEGLRDKKQRSPWMNRATARYTRKKSDARIEYPQIQQQEQALKAALYLPLLSLLFANSDDFIPDFLGDLSLNLYDVFSGNIIRSHCLDGCWYDRNIARKLYSSSVISILTYSFGVTNLIGKGYYNSALPKKYYDLIIKKSLPILHKQNIEISREERCLHSGASLMGCAFLAFNEASGVIPITGNADSWMKGGKDSMAAGICTYILNDFWAFIKDSPIYTEISPQQLLSIPVSLAYERFPDTIPDSIKAGEDLDDWLEKNKIQQDGRNRLSENTVLSEVALLLKAYSAVEWEDICVPLPSRNSEMKFKFMLMALTRKLTAELRDSDTLSDLDYKQIETWTVAIAGLFQKTEYSRTQRFMSIELLKALLTSHSFEMIQKKASSVGAFPTPTDARDVAQITIETTTELSREAVFYQYEMGRAITGSKLNQIATLDYLKGVYLANLLEQHYKKDLVEPKPITPFDRFVRNSSADLRYQLLLWFIDQNKGRLRDNPDLQKKWIETFRQISDGGYKTCEATITPGQIRLNCEGPNNKTNQVTYGETKWNQYWDSDTIECVRRGTVPLNLNVPAEKLDGEWVPVERNYLAYLLERGYKNDAVKLTLIEDDDDSILVSAAPGVNYRLPTEHWNAESLSRMREEINRLTQQYDTSSYGTYLWVSIENENGVPYLFCKNTGDENLRYRTLFEPGESFSKHDLTVDNGVFKLERDGFSVIAGVREEFDYFCVKDAGWDIIARRKGIVSCKIDEEWRSLSCSAQNEAELVRNLISLRRNQIVTLKVIMPCKPNDDKSRSMRAFTKEGIPVWVDSDSFSLDHYALNETIKNVRALLTDVPPTRFDMRPNGVVWSVNSSKGEGEVKYLDEDGVVCNLHIPLSDLGIKQVHSVYIGLPVQVKDGAAKCVQYSKGNDRAKMMTARRLWTVERRTGNAIGGKTKAYIGEYYLPDSDRPAYIVQDYQSGKLFAYNSPITMVPALCCGIRLSSAKVAILPFSRSNNDIVECRQNNKTYYGIAEQGLFLRTAVRCGSVSVRLQEHSDGNERLYDIQRVFSDPILDDKAEQVKRPPVIITTLTQSERLARSYYDDYQVWRSDPQWRINDRLYVEGRVITSVQGFHIRLDSPLKYLPKDPEKPALDNAAEWMGSIPLDPGITEIPQRFSNVPALACIRWDESCGAIAYPDETEPFDLKRFQLWLEKKHPNSQEYDECQLYFLRATDQDVQFEWGLGYILSIEKDCFRIPDISNPAAVFFYGDRIRRFRIIRTENRLCLYVKSMEDCEFSVDHLIFEQFCGTTGELPYVKVIYDKKKEKITTQRITIAKQKSAIHAERESWSFESYYTGTLDRAAEEMVRQHLPDGGEAYLLAKPTWNSTALRMEFSLTSPSVGDILCLRGTEVCKTPSGNDYYVRFAPPFESSEEIRESEISPEIRVLRRNFSFRESTLRSYYARNETHVFHQHMLVKLIENRDGRLLGTLTGLPAKSAERVREWLVIEGSQHVVVGNRVFHGKVRVEIRPGVFCEAEGIGELDMGSTGLLFLRDKVICVEAITDSDNMFKKKDRVVELLLKSKRELNYPEHKHFTVAGLPQVQLSNQRMGRYLLHVEPPRYGVLDEQGDVVPTKREPLFGYLKVEQDDRLNWRISLYLRGNRAQYVLPHKLTFMDGSVSQIVNHIRRGRWHYHDSTTVVQQNCDGEQQDVIYTYPQNSDLPVIFSDDCSLRYCCSELLRFAFPPHELEEYGIPEDQQELDGYYPVAGTNQNSIYVELMPGRVVKLPIRLLKLDDTIEADNLLHTDSISVGDQVKLCTHSTGAGKPQEIFLTDIRYGIRAFIQGEAYLNVREWARGRIELGSKSFRMKYPVLRRAPVPCHQAMKLKSDNSLVPVSHDEFPRQNDIVMVSADNAGELHAAGFPDVKIAIAENGTEGWNNYFWLKDNLRQPEYRRNMFALLGGMLPMRVEETDGNDGRLFVSYPQPGKPAPGEALCAQVVNKLTERTLLLRTGTRLIVMNISFAIGVPDELAGEIMAAAWKEKKLYPGKTLWINYCGNPRDYSKEYKTGIFAENRELFSVRPILVVDDNHGKGYLCENIKTREWVWLPLENVVRAEHATAKAAMDILCEFYGQTKKRDSGEYPVINVRKDPCLGCVSWLEANDYFKQSFMALSRGDKQKPINVRITAQLPSEDGYLYLCYERPRGNIYQLRSELEHAQTGAESYVTAFCIQKTKTNAELIPVNEARTQLHLSHYMLESLHEGYVENERMIVIEELFHHARHFHYAKPLQPAWYGGESHEAIAQLEQKLFELCDKLLPNQCENEDNVSDGVDFTNEINMAVRQYIISLSQLKDLNDIPVCVAVSLAMLLSRIAPEVSTIICHILERDADLYCCEELLLTKWILPVKENKFHKFSPIRLLERLDVRGCHLNGRVNKDRKGQLTPNQLDNLEQITETILRRNRGSQESVFPQIARNLRYAVDRQISQSIQEDWKGCAYRECFGAGSLETNMTKSEFRNHYQRMYGPSLYYVCVQSAAEIMGALSKVSTQEGELKNE